MAKFVYIGNKRYAFKRKVNNIEKKQLEEHPQKTSFYFQRAGSKYNWYML